MRPGSRASPPRGSQQVKKKYTIRARGRGCSRRQQSSELDRELPGGSRPSLQQAEWGTGHTFSLVPVGWRPAGSQGPSLPEEELEAALTGSPFALGGSGSLEGTMPA